MQIHFHTRNRKGVKHSFQNHTLTVLNKWLLTTVHLKLSPAVHTHIRFCLTKDLSSPCRMFFIFTRLLALKYSFVGTSEI